MENGEEWFKVLSGKAYMVGRKSTIKTMFQESRNGTTIDFKRAYGEPVTVTVPADNARIFDEFEKLCGLKQEKVSDTIFTASDIGPIH